MTTTSAAAAATQSWPLDEKWLQAESKSPLIAIGFVSVKPGVPRSQFGKKNEPNLRTLMRPNGPNVWEFWPSCGGKGGKQNIGIIPLGPLGWWPKPKSWSNCLLASRVMTSLLDRFMNWESVKWVKNNQCPKEKKTAQFHCCSLFGLGNLFEKWNFLGQISF